jgi:hypothetical protein
VSTQMLLRLTWRAKVLTAAAVLAFLVAAPLLRAADNSEEFDTYKVRVGLFWFYSSPTGTFQDSSSGDVININKDLNFNNYSAFNGLVDWKFTHKNHLTLTISPFQQSRTAFLDRTIMYQGQTYNVGAAVNANLKANLYAPGYAYDIIRRRRGHIGIGVQVDLFDTNASLTAKAQVTNGGIQQVAASGSASLLAPIPVAGPQYRLYLTNSPRVFIEGNLYGMYLFGYGNFVSTANNLGVTLNKHFSVNAGYALGSRLVVNNNSSSDRIGIHLVQKGVLAGVEASF